jgi:hypothetical protein
VQDLRLADFGHFYVQLPNGEAQQVYDMLSNVSLPSYNILTQLFFERFQPSNPFVHRETFSPSKCNPFLLGAVCAFGTFYTKTPKARNLGNVLIDLVHRAIILTTTRNNVHARSLSNIQALVLICIYFGNAGNRRFLEHAEACRGAVITMVRRCRLLDNVDESSAVMTSRGVEMDNEERWKTWLHWETGRRTGWSCFVADMELSSTWTLPTAFSLGELKTTIPCNEDLWEAPNAEVWASIYRNSLPTPTIDRLHQAFSNRNLARDLDQYDLFQSLVLAQSLSLVGQSIMEMSRCQLAQQAEPLRQEFVKCIEDSLASKQGDSYKRKGASYRVLMAFVVLRIHVNLQDLQSMCGRRGSAQAKYARERLYDLFNESPDHSHFIARHCAEIIHLVRTHTIDIACLSTTTFYAVVFLYAYSSYQSKSASNHSILQQQQTSPVASRIVLEQIGDLSSSNASQRLLRTMSKFFQSQLAHRTWPTCKNLGSILSDMASRESSPIN